jgi:hypothetical protein
MKFAWLGKDIWSEERCRTPGVEIIFCVSQWYKDSLSLNVKESVNPGLDPPHIHTTLILFHPALSTLHIHITLALALVVRCLLPELYTEALLKCFVAVLAHIRRCFIGISVITV